MHAKMVLVMFGTLFVGQIVLFIWRKKHPRSYNAATLLGMWLIPLGYSIYLSHSRFITVWLLYSLVTGVICRKVSHHENSVASILFQLSAAKTVISGFKAPFRPLDPSSGVQLLSEGVQNYVWCWNSRLYLFRFGLLWIPRNVYDQTRNLARFGHLTLVLRSLLRCHYQRHCRHVYR